LLFKMLLAFAMIFVGCVIGYFSSYGAPDFLKDSGAQKAILDDQNGAKMVPNGFTEEPRKTQPAGGQPFTISADFLASREQLYSGYIGVVETEEA
jgi:hypothetical protein